MIFNKNQLLTSIQIENISKLGVKCTSNTTEKEALKQLRHMPIKKRFNVTDFSTPKFNCIIKPLLKD